MVYIQEVSLLPIFLQTPRDVCAEIPVSFTDLTTGGKPDKWLWIFGDGTDTSEQNPKHIYQDTGYFDVSLVVYSNGCPDTLKLTDYIHITPPIAVFDIDYDCSAPKIITFTDQSIGADTWLWNFGDGTTSTLQNPPPHTYADTGTYKVSLTVTNFQTGCSFIQPQTVVIAGVNADFTADQTTICTGDSVLFTAIKMNLANAIGYHWKFGDGTESTDSSIVNHIYTTPGNYTVSLVITNKLGCKDSIVKDLYIKVGNPLAAFKSSAAGVCLNSPITFIDNSVANGFPIQPMDLEFWRQHYRDIYGTTF